MTDRVVTANALIEGDVVYLGQGGRWVRRLEEARVFPEGAPAEAALTAAQARTGEVVGAYLIAVDVSTGTPAPTHFREAFRQRGPSNRFHGKQAEV